MSVEVIIPYGENLYYYDANSLYPTAMLKPFNVGQPVHSLNKNLNELFGYVKAQVKLLLIYKFRFYLIKWKLMMVTD